MLNFDGHLNINLRFQSIGICTKLLAESLRYLSNPVARVGNPTGSKYFKKEALGPKYHTCNGCWNPPRPSNYPLDSKYQQIRTIRFQLRVVGGSRLIPSYLGTWTLWARNSRALAGFRSWEHLQHETLGTQAKACRKTGCRVGVCTVEPMSAPEQPCFGRVAPDFCDAFTTGVLQAWWVQAVLVKLHVCIGLGGLKCWGSSNLWAAWRLEVTCLVLG